MVCVGRCLPGGALPGLAVHCRGHDQGASHGVRRGSATREGMTQTRRVHLLSSSDSTSCGRKTTRVRVTVDVSKVTCELCQGRTNLGWTTRHGAGMIGKLSCGVCGRLIRDHGLAEFCVGGMR